MKGTEYDYIFLGAGCASLSILMRMIQSKKFFSKKILLIDKSQKKSNDRTWCFWEKEAGFFEEIVYKEWEQLLFKTGEEDIQLSIAPYTYKMVRGIDFYQHCFSKIQSQNYIDIIHATVSFGKQQPAKILIDNIELLRKKGAIVFNSIYSPPPSREGKFYLLQHFKGWIIETPKESFDEKTAVLMDFGVSQSRGTSFVYVMPLSPTRALIEYTLFTEEILLQDEYDKEIENYIQSFLCLQEYEIIDKEFGVIPMTNAISPRDENGFYHIGTAGGQTKPSTGYTFRFIQKQADLILAQLVSGKHLNINKVQSRFSFYDSTLLHILSRNLLDGKTIFSTLFQKNRASKILKFLDNETNFPEELILINSLPKKIFLSAGIKEFKKMFS